jgi:hypothetical protein
MSKSKSKAATSNAGRTREDLQTFQFEVRRSGSMKPAQVFQVGFGHDDARERLTVTLNDSWGEFKWAVTGEGLLVDDKDLPGQFGLHRKLNQQRDKICPPPPRVPSGPLFMAWLQNGAGRKQRHYFFRADKDAAAARNDALKLAGRNAAVLVGGVHQMELEEFFSGSHFSGRSNSEIFGVLPPDSQRELAEYLRYRFENKWLQWCDRLKKDITEYHNLPDREKLSHTAPRPSGLEQAAFAVLQSTRPAVEGAADKRERLERRRQALQSAVRP